ncbi:MAG: carboxypeptidase regulatory-like domain-containing protein [Candidatus Sumerlaeaceae bacterium]
MGRVSLSNGSPAAHASLRVFGYEQTTGTSRAVEKTVATAHSGEDGRYSLSFATAPTYPFLAVQHPGSAFIKVMLWQLLRPEPANDTTAGQIEHNVVLIPEAHVSGKVVHLENGSPATGILLSAESGKRYSSETVFSDTCLTSSSADGSFEMHGLPEGKCTLTVHQPGYVPTQLDLIAPVTDVNVRVSTKGARIHGQVLSRENRRPAIHTSVTLALIVANERSKGWHRFGEPVATDGNGEFAFSQLPSGSYLLFVPPSETSVPVNLAEQETTTGIVLLSHSGYTVHGGVLDAHTSQPLSGVKIGWGDVGAKNGSFVRSDSTGQYSLNGVFPDSDARQVLFAQFEGYELVGGRSFYKRPRVQVVFPGSKLDLMQDLLMVQTVPVRGKVMHTDGRAATGAAVDIGDQNNPVMYDFSGTKSATDGTFTLQGSPNTRAIVSAQLAPFPVAISKVISITSNSAPFVELVLRPSSHIVGSVIGPDNKPVAKAMVRGTEETSQPAVTDDDGRFVMEKKNSRSPQVGLFAEKKGYSRSEWTHFNLETGQSTEGLTLRLGTSHFLRGKVTDASGNPIGGVSLKLERADGSMLFYGRLKTEEDGTFRLEDLPPGMVKLTVDPWPAQTMNYQRKVLPGLAVDQENLQVVLERQQ